jgi:salicylate hydroxylase
MLIGDAAHAMAPYQAQATNQALEDVEGLSVILANASSRDKIPSLLKVWDDIRRPHASFVQKDSLDSQAKLSTIHCSDKFLNFKPYVRMEEVLRQISEQKGARILAQIQQGEVNLPLVEHHIVPSKLN